MKLSKSIITLAVACAFPLAAQAHKLWILPSATVLSADQWVTVDAAVSNDLFYPNHVPARLDGLLITSPSGKAATAENSNTGKYRSTFDVNLNENGTWRIGLAMNGLFANWTENGEPRRWRGSADAFAKEVPAKAEGLKVTQSSNRVETYVTSGNPSTELFKPTGEGLELAPVTHPNDLFAGEPATFKLLLDGAPARALKVTVVPGGTRYRDAQNEIEVTTDAEGAFSVTWPEPGFYWLNASVEDSKGVKPPATSRRAGYTATFEVLPQ